MKKYVSVLAVSPDLASVVLLKKDRGPKHLIGKLCTPGGRLEDSDESLAHAASRELAEECGVRTDPKDLINIFHRADEESEWTVFFAIADISGAKNQPGETEEVVVGDFEALRASAAAKDESYARDFDTMLTALDASSAAAAAMKMAEQSASKKKLAAPKA